jgi:hypothetical protein
MQFLALICKAFIKIKDLDFGPIAIQYYFKPLVVVQRNEMNKMDLCGFFFGCPSEILIAVD